MKDFHGVLFLLIGVVALLPFHLVLAQNQTGFISLDCGLGKGESYTEERNGIFFTSDAEYIDSGESKTAKFENRQNILKHFWFLRSFPNGTRNCYNFNLRKDQKYLIRAECLYGNYDNLNEYPSFDLHIGTNKWTSIAIADDVTPKFEEIIHVSKRDHLQVCLVKTGPTTPFISSLELRPLPNDAYRVEIGSLELHSRRYLTPGNISEYIRLSDDVNDRLWIPYFKDNWKHINTTAVIGTNNSYDLPQNAMRSAATPANASEPLNIHWTSDDPILHFQSYIYLHFAEIQQLGANETREFNITYSDGKVYNKFRPSYNMLTTISNRVASTSPDGRYNINLVMTETSTLPPLLNAYEIYMLLNFTQMETDQDEVDAMRKIKETYGLSNKTSWEGDPCAPRELRWDGLDCNYPNSDAPIIITLNLSGSGLTGEVTPDIPKLTRLTQLDLSNNDLTGAIPAFLADMKSLKVINLSGNRRLNQSIPDSLRRKIEMNSLRLILDRAPVISSKRKSAPMVTIAAPVAAVAALLVILAIFLVFKKRRARRASMVTKERRFRYSEVLKMTNNFERVLGKGGFGTVYHGCFDDTQVAVKVLSHSSAQGYRQFKAEVDLLLRVHHRNLVSLVGFCEDGQHSALIYEYMANGDLHEHLSGKRTSETLTWATRLRIAVEAAQGLEYLHNGCKPPMIHRDVKTSNVLLNEQLQAKLGDFGLSRSFPMEGETHISTVVAGSPGYLDPEYHRTNRLSEKSDVYCFGVVLLEIISNQPVIDRTRHKSHIADWVASMLMNGEIKSVVDLKLKGEYDTNSAWRALELALACVNPCSNQRPTMSHILTELNECLAFETSRVQGSYLNDSFQPSLYSVSEFAPEAR